MIVINILLVTYKDEINTIAFIQLLPTRRRKDSDTENDNENGLRMKSELTMKEKRFSFFADPQKKGKESHHTFAHLAACIRTKPTQEGTQKSKFFHSSIFFVIYLKMIIFECLFK